ncbi:DNA-binding response OmpR family regulator [Nocardioides ginsengisegetis]|uniref:DNA-binding response OmpR family regulator n=1 Tax=Nocardioides ginsengisegetis TaxID=661491 RepID=A0A7W3IX95_9ACTN|nr:response regulator transcription factor [Nocardioides ginsengisegetis]MBA8802310.1 DNA-binding response OmpR family regulator [Nocardioides ginsengisegetis]
MGVGEDWVAVIIEDDPDVRDLIDIVLTQSGFRTVVTQDGYEGVEAVRTHNPLITTLDVNMPGMDGFAAAKRLREFSNTYLIMITALGDEIDVVQGFEAGADDYLVKPFRPRELRARADSMLRRPRARQETPSGWSEGADDSPVSPVAAPAAVPPPPAPEPVKEESWAARAARDLTANAPHRAAPVPVPVPVQQPVQPPAPQPAYQQPPAHQPPAQPVVPQPIPQPIPQSTPQPAYAPPVPEQAPQPTPPVQASQPVPPALQGEGVPRPDGSWVRFNGLALNQETRVVTVGGGSIDLNRTEFDLLASLLSTGRRVRSKADLVLTMRGQQYVTSYFVNEADKRSVEVHIASMRRKLNDNDQNPRFIETVRGVGYRLAEPV